MREGGGVLGGGGLGPAGVPSSVVCEGGRVVGGGGLGRVEGPGRWLVRSRLHLRQARPAQWYARSGLNSVLKGNREINSEVNCGTFAYHKFRTAK